MPFPIRVGPTQVATGSATTVHTATKDQRVTGMYVGDRSGSNKTITVHLVGANGSAANTNKWFDALPVIANDWISYYPISIPMIVGETLQCLASGGAGVMVMFEVSDEKGTTWR